MHKTITALITPFRDGDLDEEGFRKNIRFQIEEGIDALLALGSTGEGETLSERERLLTIQIAREETRGKVPLWIQTGDSATDRTIKKTKEAEKLGADGALIITPYYCRPTQEGLLRHFEAVANSTSLPIILYHHPKRTGVFFEIATLKHLSQIDNIIGLKDASGDVGFVAQVLNAILKFDVFSGDDLLSLPLMSIGAKGVISVMSNLIPRKMCELIRSKAKSLYYELFPLFQFSQCETNPIPIKAMMKRFGMPAGECRLPLTPLSKKYQKQMDEMFSAYV